MGGDAVHELGEKIDRIASIQATVRDMDRRLRTVERDYIMTRAVAWIVGIALLIALIVILILFT
jgi:hypothetical protein